MQGSDTLIRGSDKVTYKDVQSIKFDSSILKKEQPEVYNKYNKIVSYKRFIVS